MHRGLYDAAECAKVRSTLLKVPSVPDRIWERVKTWAKAQAASSADPSLEECERFVRNACHEVSGRLDALPAQVVAFYASEIREMILKYRAAANAEDGVA